MEISHHSYSHFHAHLPCGRSITAAHQESTPLTACLTSSTFSHRRKSRNRAKPQTRANTSGFSCCSEMDDCWVQESDVCNKTRHLAINTLCFGCRRLPVMSGDFGTGASCIFYSGKNKQQALKEKWQTCYSKHWSNGWLLITPEIKNVNVRKPSVISLLLLIH